AGVGRARFVAPCTAEIPKDLGKSRADLAAGDGGVNAAAAGDDRPPRPPFRPSPPARRARARARLVEPDRAQLRADWLPPAHAAASTREPPSEFGAAPAPV